MSKPYRRLSLIVVPLMFALIGCGASGQEPEASSTPASSAPASSSTQTSTTTATPQPAGPFGAMKIVRTTNGFTLTGELPDDEVRTSLPASIRQAMPGANIVDELVVKPGVTSPEFAGLGALFGAAVDIRGFGVNLVGDTATLTGSAETEEPKAAAETATAQTWPKVKIVNDIRVTPTAATTATPAPAGNCGTVRADVGALLTTPITFATDGSTLSAAARKLVDAVAAKAAACQGIAITVVGFTDDTGGDAINGPLSAGRAKAVADELISKGVGQTAVTSRGAGAASPVAGNDTATGRAQNRRVEITVS